MRSRAIRATRTHAIELTKGNAFCRGALFVMALALGACGGGSTDPKAKIPFQGPLNASFETADGWVLSSSSDICNNALGSQRATLLAGTGFLPSAGVRYASLAACSWLTSGRQATVYQDTVDLTHSTTLTFDYSLSGTVGAGGGAVTAQILFTSAGTVTLWSKSLTNASTLPIQKLTETVQLPTTAGPGRLTIALFVAGASVPPSTATKTDMILGIDNIVVK